MHALPVPLPAPYAARLRHPACLHLHPRPQVAGTEQGVTEPTATFSACFGSAFLVLHPFRWVQGRGGILGGSCSSDDDCSVPGWALRHCRHAGCDAQEASASAAEASPAAGNHKGRARSNPYPARRPCRSASLICRPTASLSLPPTPHALRYAAMLADKLAQHGTNAWLINTGWTGGK